MGKCFWISALGFRFIVLYKYHIVQCTNELKELPAFKLSSKETFAMIPYHLVHMGTSKHIAASYWWSGSSQTCSDWSNPEQWPAEGLNTDQCERSSELPYLGLPRHHGAAGGGGEGGGRGLGHPQQVQCRPLSSELSEGKNASDWGKTTKNYFFYFRQRDLMWVQFRGKTSGQASTPLWLSHLHSRYVELFEAKKGEPKLPLKGCSWKSFIICHSRWRAPPWTAAGCCRERRTAWTKRSLRWISWIMPWFLCSPEHYTHFYVIRFLT